jgi:hypothetical protein
LNRAADSIATVVSHSREMATESGLRYGVVRQDVTVTKRANEADLDAHVT